MPRTWLINALQDNLQPLWFDEAIGPAQTLSVSTSQHHLIHALQASPSDGQEYTFGVFARAGVFVLTQVGIRNSVYCKADTYVDGTLVQTGFDWYAASPTFNVINSFSITFLTSGWHVIKIKVNGKNGSSSNYYLVLTGIGLLPQLGPTFVENGYTVTEAMLPKRASRMFREFIPVGGAPALVYTIDNAQAHNGYWDQGGAAGAADGQAYETSVYIAAGAYTLGALGVTAADCGKVDWYLDGVITGITAQDWYSAAMTRLVLKTGSLTVATGGKHILKAVVNGRNASSTDFRFPLTRAWLRQAAD